MGSRGRWDFPADVLGWAEVFRGDQGRGGTRPYQFSSQPASKLGYCSAEKKTNRRFGTLPKMTSF